MSFFAAAKRERVAAGVLVGLAVVFVGVALLQRVHRGDADVLLPLALLAADLTIAAALLSGWYSVRPVAQGLAIFGALAHVLLLLGGRPELIRVTSGLLAAAHVYSLVLLFQLGAGYEDEDEEQEAGEVAPARVAESSPAEAASTPRLPEPSGDQVAEPAPEQSASMPAAEPLAAEEDTASADTAPAADAPDADADAGSESDAGVISGSAADEEPASDAESTTSAVVEQADPAEPQVLVPDPAGAEQQAPGEVPTARSETGQNESDQDQSTRDQAVPVTTTVGAEQASSHEERAT